MQNMGVMSLDAVSPLALFLGALAENGRPVVSIALSPGDDPEAIEVLRQLDVRSRCELALDAPAFQPAAALWAARLFYELCRAAVCRDLGEEFVNAISGTDCPEPRCPETDWSVDLVLRHLPGLFGFAQHLSNGDPLLEQIQRIAAAWPLSSVGTKDVSGWQLNSFIKHPAMLRLYADRIVAAADVSRAADPCVNDVLRADIGIHRDSAPALASLLFKT